MKILVTGGAGFLGSNLIEKLLKTDCEVVAVDNLLTGNINNLKEFKGFINFTFIEGDIIQVAKALKPGFDQIYHLASPASPPKYIKYAYETMMVNTLGTDELCKYAMSNKSRILFSSTSEIYGDPEVHPQIEEYWGNVNPIGIRSVYDESKRFGETIISHYSRTNSLNSVIVRIFNTYGPKMDPHDGRVVTNFVRQIVSGEKISMYGDGSQTRSFCYVSDLVEGLIMAMNSKESGPINLGNPNEFTLIQLLDVISTITETAPELEFHDLPSDDPKKRNPNIDFANNTLGWKPTIELEEGLKETISWIKANI
jgi:nucleoside-diphosphate-sugar epimerase